MQRDWFRSGPFGPAGPFAFGRSRFFEDGEVRLAVLSLLEEGDRNGYQIIKALEERSGGLYKPSAGTIYPTLQMLEDEGLIEATEHNGRRTFRLTEAGRAELAQDPDAVKRIWDRAASWGDWSPWFGPQIVAYSGPLRALMKSTMRAAHWAHGNSERDSKLRSVLEEARKELDALSGA